MAQPPKRCCEDTEIVHSLCSAPCLGPYDYLHHPSRLPTLSGSGDPRLSLPSLSSLSATGTWLFCVLALNLQWHYTLPTGRDRVFSFFSIFQQIQHHGVFSHSRSNKHLIVYKYLIVSSIVSHVKSWANFPIKFHATWAARHVGLVGVSQVHFHAWQRLRRGPSTSLPQALTTCMLSWNNKQCI